MRVLQTWIKQGKRKKGIGRSMDLARIRTHDRRTTELERANHYTTKEKCEKIRVFKPLYQWYNKIVVLRQQIKGFSNNEKLELGSPSFLFIFSL